MQYSNHIVDFKRRELLGNYRPLRLALVQQLLNLIQVLKIAVGLTVFSFSSLTLFQL